MFSNAEKEIINLLNKERNTIKNITTKLISYDLSDIKDNINKLIVNNIVYKKKNYYYLNNDMNIIDNLTSSESYEITDNYDEYNNNIFFKNNEVNNEVNNKVNNEFNNKDELSEVIDDELNITFNKVSDIDDGVKFSIDKDNKVVNLNLNLILEISGKNLKQYRPKELELNLKIPKSVYLLISKKLDEK